MPFRGQELSGAFTEITKLRKGNILKIPVLAVGFPSPLNQYGLHSSLLHPHTPFLTLGDNLAWSESHGLLESIYSVSLA